MSRIKIILLICFVLAISCMVIGIYQLFQKEEPKPPIVIASHELSSQEYQEIRDNLVHILEEKDPRFALTVLREKAGSNEAIARSCHDLVHEIGHEAYEKYSDFGKAMQYQDDMCNSGYLHGIIESHFKNSQDILATLNTVCQAYNAESFLGWECYHGVGHGLMYFTENDLPKSLSLCDTYSNHAAQKACINGVFMENFNVDQKLHVSKFVKADEPFYPCTEEKTAYKDCYLYAPTYYLSLHKNKYTDAITICKTAEKEYQLICISGVGSQAIKEHINNPALVESVCMQGSSEETSACIAGMVGLYINHFGGVKEAKELCPKLEKSNQTTCEQTIASQEALF
jgi:hypothetical protein